jgi:hypothetical protein
MPPKDEAVAEVAATEPVAPVEATPVEAALAAPRDEVADVVEAERKKWRKTLVVCGGRIPTDESRKVIVVESRTLPKTQIDGTLALDAGGKPVEPGGYKKTGYPTKGDLYYRTEPDVEFPEGSQVLTLGVDVIQGTFWGFCPDMPVVNVGPCHPAYAAANLAFQRGAEEIEIIGLQADEKAKLLPYFNALAEGGPPPRITEVGLGADVRAPADVKITLT